MPEKLTPKVLIIGAGTGGYPTAIRCGQLGFDTVMVDAGVHTLPLIPAKAGT
jgi:dihydrolipoamide dehydrogenase